MSLCEQNLDLPSGSGDLGLSKVSNSLALARQTRRRAIGLALSKLREPLVVVYGRRFKEMLRDQNAIQLTRDRANAISQFARQAPK
jgi:hypothetical protein